jgi:hypothetical protein
VTFSYSVGNTARDDVRLLIGDVDYNVSEDLRLEDEDIERILVLQAGSSSPGDTGVFRAAAFAAEILASKFDRKAEGSPGPDRVMPSNRAAGLRATAERLRRQLAAHAVPSAGGISVSAKAARAGDSDRPCPAFSLGMLDNNGSV